MIQRGGLDSLIFPGNPGIRARSGGGGDTWNFITRTGNTLYDGSQEYRAAGTNIGWLGIDFVPGGGFAPPPTSTLRVPSAFRVNDVFTTAQMMGCNTVRMGPCMGGVGYTNSGYPTLGGALNETVFVNLDYVIATARIYGIRLMFALIDYNEGFYWGSKANFSNWGGTNFFTDSTAINNFKAFVSLVLNRTNTVNGLAYKDDPTILAWETINEADPPTAWTTTIAAYIKSIDPIHLVADGKTPSVRSTTLDANSLTDPNIDIVGDHYYPMSTSALSTVLATANLSNKVFMVTEYDWPSTRGGGSTLAQFIAAIESHSEIKGSLIWNLGAHSDTSGWDGYANDYTIACPENTGLDLEYGRSTIQTKVDAIRAHHFAFRGISATAFPSVDAPVLSVVGVALSWRGVACAKFYHMQRSTTSSSSGFADVATTLSDADSAWTDPSPPVVESWYRLAGENGAAALGPWSNVATMPAPPAFNPSTVSGYARDWDFSDATKIYKEIGHTTLVSADADPIGSVLCTAGSGLYMAAAADDTTRFTYKVNLQNGLSMGRADGVNDILFANQAADASITLFVVLKKPAAVGASSKTAFSFNLPNAQVYTNSASPSAGGYNYFATAAAGEAAIGGTATDCTILCLKYTSNADLKLYANGGAPASSIDPHNDYQAQPFLVLARSSSGAPQFGAYDFGRVMVFTNALSTTDMDYIFNGLGDLWNVTVTPTS